MASLPGRDRTEAGFALDPSDQHAEAHATHPCQIL